VERNAAPARFTAALESLKLTQVRPEVHLSEAPAPTRIAPYAVAIDGVVYADGQADDARFDLEATEADPIAQGTLIILFDPQSQTNWGGQFRIVSFIEVEVDHTEAADPMLPGVAWTWVTDAIGHHPYHNLTGTVSVTSSTTFDDAGEKPGKAVLEIRASWSPNNEQVGVHLNMWAEMLAIAGGLEHSPTEVTSLFEHRAAQMPDDAAEAPETPPASPRHPSFRHRKFTNNSRPLPTPVLE